MEARTSESSQRTVSSIQKVSRDSQDRTDYWQSVPSNTLELALFLESDRMGHLLDVMSPARVDQQRYVVKNGIRALNLGPLKVLSIDEVLGPPSPKSKVPRPK